MTPWLLLLLGWLGMMFVMYCLWRYQQRHGDAGIVDVAWGLGVGGLGVLYSVLSDTGDPIRRTILGTIVLIWSIRLSLHIYQRLKRLPEDGRYQELKSQWGPQAQANLYYFYQLQAFWSVLFASPILLAARNPLPAGNLYDLIGISIWCISLIGETIADRQLSHFRMNPSNRGQVCRRGLWYYSRHPNYFFEWLHWWAYVFLAIGAEWGWLTLAGPVAMLFFLLKVTGIPPTEAQALKSRGDAYRDYQRTTSVFFPWPPRKGGAQ